MKSKRERQRIILDNLWEKAYSGGLREHRKVIDIDQALSDLAALDREDTFPYCAKNCEVIKELGAGECENVCPIKFREVREFLNEKEIRDE